jgi:arabinose-5-phosphate isomerase
MLKTLFNEQHQYLEYFFNTLDHAQAEAVFQACLETKGLLVLTGVGKSGIVAEKIAMTLISTGTKALHLPTTNFLHGDIGILSPDDTVLFFSKSGETEELLNLLPFVKRRGAKVISLVSNPQSRLAVQADLSLCLPVEKELCPFDLAPTTSTQVQLLFGDVLAIGLMKARGFTLEAYGTNHPLGTIGKKIALKVEDVMMRDTQVPLCSPEDRLGDVLSTLSEKKCGCLVVVDEAKAFHGIFTDGDLRRALQSLGSVVLEKKIKDLMTRSATAVQQGERAWDAMKIMQKDPKKWIMVLPVLEQNKVVGIVRMHDIIHAGIS